jgi:hypothetical protein
MVGRIDWDVFVDGQDWKLSDLKITPVSQSATQADIRATFTNLATRATFSSVSCSRTATGASTKSETR